MASEQEAVSQRLVAGLWCRDVLEALPDFVEGELPAERRAAVEAHVSACDWCERFGGIYGSLVARLREGATRVPDGLTERLSRKLEHIFEEEP